MILITTVGKVGTETARLLAAADEQVRVLARDPAQHDVAGVEVVSGDLTDPGSVAAALEGVDRVVLVSAAVPSQELAVIAAAKSAGTGFVVKVSSKASPDSPVARRRGQSEIEAGLVESGLDHTILRPNAYMQNLLALGPVVAATGGFSASTGAGQVGLTDARDVGAVAAHVVADPGSHVGRTYWVTGPQLLSYADVADTLTDVLGRTITFTPRTRDEDLQAFLAAGVPADVAENNATAFSLIADGDAAWLSDDLPKLLGRPARSFVEFARENASLFG